ncbi:hypothetical protein [Photobacterium galatheae]|uniref:Uncharacterized protein n=1 Tax=Photobacterium galatheae TaxID=1654360 RepID=A0A066RI07_9GAMM|nr:hypothetical protein [Photobacterium galatheae]KDM89959.1 hypothetical protein EA58_19640 [Photobacterium galatheae]MCM0149246.1 hypothetical protein [Photobacterium galatheae]
MKVLKDSITRIISSNPASQKGLSIYYDSVFSYLGLDIDGIALSASSNSTLLLHRGVDCLVHLEDTGFFIEKLSRQDMMLDIFHKQVSVRNRGEFVLAYSNINDLMDISTLETNVYKFLKSATSGNGLALVGSPSVILNAALLDYVERRLSGSVCRLVYLNGTYRVLEYSSCGSFVVSQVDFKGLSQAVNYIQSSPYRFVLFEAYSGFHGISEALELSLKGKSVIYCECGISAMFSIYTSQNELDAQIFASLFSGALYLNYLPYVKGVRLPKVKFGEHESCYRWASLKTSPTKDELILIDPISGIESVAIKTLILSEVVESSKSLKKWISENQSPVDMAANLRLEQGWLSISDEAAIAAREESVTFDQVMKKITLI